MADRRLMGALALLACVLLAACGSAEGAETVDLRVQTATPTTPARLQTPAVPGATPAPLEQPELVLSSTTTSVAGTLLVSVTGDVRSGSASFLGRSYELTQGARSMYTFIGVDVDDPPGSAMLEVSIETSNGSRGVLQETIEVEPTEWTVDHLEFAPGVTDELLDPAVTEAEQQRLAAVYGTYTPEKFWDGPWQIPVEGPITAEFGEQRSYDGGPATGHHGGTDISAIQGTPVIATNSGVVVMAEEMALRGNMVIIDHGGGLLSGYGHLSAIDVSVGQTVEAGEVIASVGNTGLSTGAHLHWEMAVHGIVVNPWGFVDGSNGF